MLRLTDLVQVCVVIFTYSFFVLAWDNHSLGTYLALSEVTEVRNAPKVKVETLEQFLSAEYEGLNKVLCQEEKWAIQNLSYYPAQPFSPSLSKDSSHLREQFMERIRINPLSKLSLFLQLLPGQSSEREVCPTKEVTTMPDSLSSPHMRFVRLQAGEEVSPFDVVVTASDEPDYGLDVGLFKDNKTLAGNRYGFGEQPFGNPSLEYASQAPFHMGFYHEPALFFSVASYLAKTLPEYRIHLYYTLARYAFQTGHDYWGWRFTGWGMHYIQDLTQPYHSAVVPGEHTIRVLMYGLLDVAGVHKFQSLLIDQVTKEHLALEEYEYEILEKILLSNNKKHPIYKAMTSLKEETNRFFYTPTYVREQLSLQSYLLADGTSKMLRNHLKNPLPTQDHPPVLVHLLKNFAVHSRAFVKAAKA